MRRITLVGCWFGLALSAVATVFGAVELWQGNIGEWEAYQKQPSNSALDLVVSAIAVIVLGVSVYKLHTDPKWNGWAKNEGIYAQRKPREKGYRLPPPQ